MTLVKYRDAGMHTHTYFYVNQSNSTVSPFFDSEEEAKQWLEKELIKWENFKLSRDL